MMKTRFCPSPTGHMHLGNARTALFSTLLANKYHGHFLIRIEDTDLERSKEAHTDQILADLRWLGIEWQEGPEVGGDVGPYWQSQRAEIYAQYYQQLQENGQAYPCFCTPEQLALSRKIQRSQGKPPRYAGTCRELTQEQIERKLEQGLQPTLRFYVIPKEVVQFHDLVKGRQRFNTDDIGDFVIRRADKTPAFFFCNAIDDALMKVTHVIRGEDHLTNTPRQLLILQALDLPLPEYGHIPLIIGMDGSPLSKRHGSKSVKELREIGYLPLAINNYLARLGHHYQDDYFRSLDELSQAFSLDRLSKGPARFDINQLDYWQQETIKHSDAQILWHWLGEEVHDRVPSDKKDLFADMIRSNVNFPKEAVFWAKIFFTDEFDYAQGGQEILLTASPQFFQEAIDCITKLSNDYQQVCQALSEKLHVKGKSLFMPLRIAMTGQMHGPELAKIFILLGRDNLIKRFSRAQAFSKDQIISKHK